MRLMSGLTTLSWLHQISHSEKSNLVWKVLEMFVGVYGEISERRAGLLRDHSWPSAHQTIAKTRTFQVGNNELEQTLLIHCN